MSFVPVTEQRLWALYCVAGLSYREITELTGWKWNELKLGIRKWNLALTHTRHIDADVAIRSGLSEAFHVYKNTKPLGNLPMGEATRVFVESTVLANESRKVFQKRLLAGDVEWDLIDTLDIAKSVIVLTRCLREAWASETI